MTCMKKRIAAALTTEKIRGLIIGSNGSVYTVISSAPTVVQVTKVLGYWTATAKNPGTATITVTAPDGWTGSVTITVEPATPSDVKVEGSKGSTDLMANIEIIREMIRLINQTRRASGPLLVGSTSPATSTRTATVSV